MPSPYPALVSRILTAVDAHRDAQNWESELDDERALEFAGSLAKLWAAADQILITALDASIAVVTRERLSDLIGR